MRRNKQAMYLHLVWATWDREPLVTPDIERRIHRSIETEARGMGCDVLAIGGMPEHVHLVVKIPATVTIADLVKQVKGVSSHFAGETLGLKGSFKWQGTYGAFSVSRWDVDRVIGYVERQKQHHADESLVPDWEEAAEETDPPALPPLPGVTSN